MNYIWIGLAGGAAASRTAWACARIRAPPLSRARPLGDAWPRLLWLAGKTLTYSFLGAMGAFFGRWLGGVAIIPRIQDVLTYAGAA